SRDTRPVIRSEHPLSTPHEPTRPLPTLLQLQPWRSAFPGHTITSNVAVQYCLIVAPFLVMTFDALMSILSLPLMSMSFPLTTTVPSFLSRILALPHVSRIESPAST